MNCLIIYKEYFVDFKLRQFRKIENGKLIFIDFNSEEGRKLLKEFKNYKLTLERT